ncbi:phosphoethanolamine transferase domain-containing protein, partial [Acinetobacter baumannii]
SSYFVNTLGVIISPDQIQNMVQTDVSEVTDLISLRFVLWTIFFVILPIFLITQVKFKQEKVSRLLLKKVFSLVASFAVVGVLLF